MKEKEIGRKIGFLVMYLIFTILFYFILKLLNKLPGNWGIFHVAILTLSIVLTGILIKLLLKR